MRKLSPNTIKNVTPYVIENPYRIDMVCKAIQSSLSEIEWIEKSFARAVIMSNEREGRDYLFPAMFVQKGFDFLDMLFQDNYSAYSFFIARDSETAIDYQVGIRNTFQRRLSLIVWCNLQSVDPERMDDFTEQLKSEVIDKVVNTSYTQGEKNGEVLDVELTEIYDEPENVFEGFSLELAKTQYLYYPYRGFRIDMTCSYLEECNTVVDPCTYVGGNIESGSAEDGWVCELINSGTPDDGFNNLVMDSGEPEDGWTN